MLWFDPDNWCGKEIVFPEEPTVTWVLEEKLDEKFCQRAPDEAHEPSTAWAVFSCNRKDGIGLKHAIKIWLQVPHTNTEFKSVQLRRAQADITNQPRRLKDEIAGLTQLTLNNSQHTPLFVSVLHTQQGDDALVPSGFITYILMTWCPGEPLFEHNYFSKSEIERHSIHEAFADAWNDTLRCGVLNRFPERGDLIWDAAANRCYMVDFKRWSPPVPADTIERAYNYWGL